MDNEKIAQKGNELYMQGKYLEAIREYKKIECKDKNIITRTQYNIGCCYSKLYRLSDNKKEEYIKESLKANRIVFETAPKEASIYEKSLFNSALCYFYIKDYKKAYIYINKYMAIMHMKGKESELIDDDYKLLEYAENRIKTSIMEG